VYTAGTRGRIHDRQRAEPVIGVIGKVTRHDAGQRRTVAPDAGHLPSANHPHRASGEHSLRSALHQFSFEEFLLERFPLDELKRPHRPVMADLFALAQSKNAIALIVFESQ
jgi:hypothetical protein